MPIRTDRGRAAATRAFWSWPLRSGRHMLATAVGVAAVLTAVAVASNALQGDRHAAAPAGPTSSAAAPPLAPTSSAPGTSGYNPASSTAPATTVPASTAAGTASAGTPGALTTAKAFMAHWIRPPAGTSTAQWADGLRAYVMPESIAELDTVDPQNIPARKVTGDPQVTKADAAVVEANVPTDAGLVHLVIVAYTDGRWLVRTWEPV